MTRILVVGDGALADFVQQRLDEVGVQGVLRQAEVGGCAPTGVNLVLVLDDAWHPAVHVMAEQVYRKNGILWLRAFAAFGNGVIGPLVRPNGAGCSQCADLRLLMAGVNRREMLGMRGKLAAAGGIVRDPWATSATLRFMATLVVAEVSRLLADVQTCHVVDHLYHINLKTLDAKRHFVLPHANCPVCGNLPEDTPESAVMALAPTPKPSTDNFRVKSIRELAPKLTHDYLDSRTGLLNGKVHDLVTPFAAVSVNLPLLMGDEGTSGRSHSYDTCEPIAILEGLERFCGLEPRGKKTSVFGSYAQLQAHALHPATVGLHAREQYLQSDFPYQAFDEQFETDWVWGYSLNQRRPILVPQRLAYYSLGWRDGFVYETSNGCAIGGSLVEAIFHGMLEIVERDAFLMTWYAQLPLPRIDPASIPDIDLQWMIERIRAVAGYDLHLYNATLEHGIPTVFLIAKNQREEPVNLLCAAGAHIDPIRAIESAIQETAGMLMRFDEKLKAQRHVYLQMLQDSRQVRQMEDHSMLYGLPEAESRLSFLLNGASPVQTLSEAFKRHARHLDLTQDLSDLIGAFEKLRMDVIVVNQTCPEIERHGLHCVKVLIPGMLPMTFGHHLTRLEGLDRVLQVPMQLGYVDQPLRKEELNPHPHPFP